MKINLKYTVALNILIVCDICKDKKITANYINKVVGCDVTTIRMVMYDLKQAGLIEGKPGPGGIKLLRNLDDVTLFDVYASVLDPKESMLKFYEGSEDEAQLSNAIKSIVDEQFNDYRDLLLAAMKIMTVKTLCRKIQAELYNSGSNDKGDQKACEI